jgi:predicted ABC-type ATPase
MRPSLSLSLSSCSAEPEGFIPVAFAAEDSEVKRCYIIAGPNGAGKTTFARAFLPLEGECVNFVNVDLIAQGLSPLAPDKVRIEAGRLLLQRIEACAARGEAFAFETTLSGKRYVERIRRWQEGGYQVIIYYLRLPSVEMAIDRVKIRVAQGGHNVPEEDVRRRFERGWRNLQEIYRNMATPGSYLTHRHIPLRL